MPTRSTYSWFIAKVWPDERGVPSAVIFECDYPFDVLGRQVHTVQFGLDLSFDDAIAKLGYEIVKEVVAAVTPTGVMITLRRERVPVYVPAGRRAYA